MTHIQRLQLRDAMRGIAPNAPDNVIKRAVDREAGRVVVTRLDVNSFVPLALAALAGYVRHNLTPYDYLLAEKHLTRFQAQTKVHPQVTAILNKWR